MTLNITVFSKHFIIQASDRCISVGRVPVEDWNKAVVVRSRRLSAVLTYTGAAGCLERLKVADLAGMGMPKGGSGTADALAQRICRAEGAEWDLRQLANSIRHEADGLFSELPREFVERHTAFTLAGWDRGSDQPRGYHIHNCLDQHARMTPVCRSAFAVQVMDLSQPDHYAGISDAVHRRRRKRIREALHSSAQVEHVVEAIAEAFRSAAAIESRISAECLTIYLPPEGNAEAKFHGDCPVVYGPAAVMLGGERGTMVVGCVQANIPVGGSIGVGDFLAGLGTRVSRG